MSDIKKIDKELWAYTCDNCNKKRVSTREDRAIAGVCGKCRSGINPVKGQLDVFGNVIT